MLFYTQSPLKFAFSKEENELEKRIQIDDKRRSEFGIVGVPFDSTTTYKSGARFGPKAIREASYNFERYNLILDKKLDVPVYDFGDIEVIQGNFKKTCSMVHSTISELLKKDITPIVTGGEHTISYGVLKALDIENTTIIHFDAHMDMRDEYMGEKYSHATVMRRIFDLDPKNMIQIGIRSCSEDEALFATENNIQHYTSHDANKDLNMIKKAIKGVGGPLYVSVDIDVLDPAYAPSVSTPTPCGLDSFQLESLIHCLEGKEVVGFDLVEVSSVQFGDITSINGVKVIYDFLCLQ